MMRRTAQSDPALSRNTELQGRIPMMFDYPGAAFDVT